MEDSNEILATSTDGNIEKFCSIFQIELTSPLDCDIKVELDVSGVYCKVAEGGSPAAELSSKFHHWGTCFYLGLIIAKVSKYAHHYSLQAGNIQYERAAVRCMETFDERKILSEFTAASEYEQFSKSLATSVSHLKRVAFCLPG